MNKTKPTVKRAPPLPKLLDRKIYKTGQTRGADDDEIYQNRVLRRNTVLIGLSTFLELKAKGIELPEFENGYIVLISPREYFSDSALANIFEYNLEIGKNLLIFYQLREDWETFNPLKQEPPLLPANSRGENLGGQYVARIPGTTGTDGEKIIHGYNTSNPKGAGIRLFEYADEKTIADARIQLECLFWCCEDAVEVVTDYGMSEENTGLRRKYIFEEAMKKDIWNQKLLKENRVMDVDGYTICPLCLMRISSRGFFEKEAQAEGREVHNLTVTQLNLFHISELRVGRFEHKPYNLGWGHHHCNTVVRDSGIIPTLRWMDSVVVRNKEDGYNF